MLFASDLIEHDGGDLRDLPLIDRKRRLAKLIGKAKRRAIRYSERWQVTARPCSSSLQHRAGGHRVETDGAPYRSGPSKVWLKSKNPASEAVRREREEEWRYARPSCCRQ